MLDQVQSVPMTLLVYWSLREVLRVSFIASSHHHGSVFRLVVLHRGFSLGILVTWPVHLNCANFRSVCTLCIPVLFRTSVSGTLSCHLIFRSFLTQLVWKWFSLWHAIGKLSKFHRRIIMPLVNCPSFAGV